MDTPKLTLLVEKTRPDAITPSKAHESDSGFDLTLLGKAKDLSSPPSWWQKLLLFIGVNVRQDVALYHTGVKATLQEPGWDLKIYPRSSISKTGYMLANSIGVVDQSYRGEIFVALRKVDSAAPDLTFPAKLVQLVPERVPSVQVVEASLDQTDRGAGGFGSTGS